MQQLLSFSHDSVYGRLVNTSVVVGCVIVNAGAVFAIGLVGPALTPKLAPTLALMSGGLSFALDFDRFRLPRRDRWDELAGELESAAADPAREPVPNDDGTDPDTL
jgi:hypothetical protein